MLHNKVTHTSRAATEAIERQSRHYIDSSPVRSTTPFSQETMRPPRAYSMAEISFGLTLVSMTLCLLVIVLSKPNAAVMATTTFPATAATESSAASTMSPPALAPDGRQEVVIPFQSEQTFSDGKDVSPAPKIYKPVTTGKEVIR